MMSTDFSVHAHWLYITSSSSLAPSQWYVEQTSRWTLDYPPVFAWFEYLLANNPVYPPPPSLVSNLDEPYACFRQDNSQSSCFSAQAVLWHRASVAVSEFLVLAAGVWAFARTWPTRGDDSELVRTPSKLMAATVLVAFDCNLFLVDNVHFQYNGVLLGVLLLSMASLRAGRDFVGALLFALLLCFKHIFVYAAPLYFVYLLRRSIRYHKDNRLDWGFLIHRLAVLGSIVLGVFAAAVYSVCGGGGGGAGGTLPCVASMLGRLFPVGERGLLHAYWAPNVWAGYAALDKLLKTILLGGSGGGAGGAGVSSSSGLVSGAIEFDVLPSVPAYETVFLSVLGMCPALYKVWQCAHPQLFLHAYCVCVLSFFLFGYHVHEKALLMCTVPLALVAVDSVYDARVYLCLQAVALVSLSPLLFVRELTLVKLCVGSTAAGLAYVVLDEFHLASKRRRRIAHQGRLQLTRSALRVAYFCGLLLVWLQYELGLVPRLLLVGGGAPPRFDFLPLLLVSCYCAAGVAGCWVELYLMLDRKQSAIETYSSSWAATTAEEEEEVK